MKAITICQPYASLIMLPETDPRHKRVENRKWHCWESVVGQRVAIHAGKSREWLESWVDAYPDPMPFSAILGTAIIAASLPILAIRAERYAERFPWLNDHDHAEGPICWVLTDVRPFASPIPCKGAQGLWDVPAAIEIPQW